MTDKNDQTEKSIGDIIDEAIGIKGPEDLLKLVIIGVFFVILLVAFFMSKMEKYSTNWWSLLGFECIAVLLCASTVYVVMIVLPSIQKPTEVEVESSKKCD